MNDESEPELIQGRKALSEAISTAGARPDHGNHAKNLDRRKAAGVVRKIPSRVKSGTIDRIPQGMARSAVCRVWNGVPSGRMSPSAFRRTFEGSMCGQRDSLAAQPHAVRDGNCHSM